MCGTGKCRGLMTVETAVRGSLARGVVALTVVLAGPLAALADPVRMDVASTFPNSMPILGDVAHGLPEKIARASGGTLILKFHDPGTLTAAAYAVRSIGCCAPCLVG
jgi:TRAP-type mannitol/chloroaromatic compound transport system substrate-binding protein